jgi:HD-like signal output (HDOD) protein
MIKAPTTPLKQTLPLNLTSFEQRFADKYRECALNCSKIFSDPSFDLPMLPATGIRMMKLLQDPNASPKKIATALQTDAVITAKFLRLANSPFYAGTRKVESVQFAIDRLGMSTTRNVIMSISVNSTIVRERRIGERAMGIWEHAKNAALAAQLLASRLELMPQRAYMMGLMHDIGYLPAWIMIHDLAKQLPGVRPEIYKSLVEEVHVDVGNWLMTVWAMPADVCVAVGAHHLVTSVRDAMEFIIKSRTDVSVTDCSSMSAHLGCMVIADKALAVLKSSDESCDQDLGKLELAGDIGLSEELLNNYLAQLPKFLNDNHFKEM